MINNVTDSGHLRYCMNHNFAFTSDQDPRVCMFSYFTNWNSLDWLVCFTDRESRVCTFAYFIDQEHTHEFVYSHNQPTKIHKIVLLRVSPTENHEFALLHRIWEPRMLTFVNFIERATNYIFHTSHKFIEGPTSLMRWRRMNRLDFQRLLYCAWILLL